MDAEPETRARDRDELLARIDRSWTALLAAAGRLTEADLAVPDEGGWSAKDNLAHLEDWERWLLRHHLQGEPPHEVLQVDYHTWPRLDEDAQNDILFRRSRARAAADVWAGLRGSHEELVTYLSRLPFADLMQQHYPDDPARRPLLDWVAGNTYEHYDEHRAVIEKIARRLAAG